MTEPSRKDQILQSFAAMQESAPGTRITTAALATQVGVSEAALYRHFPSKAKMFEGLLDFIEDSLLPRIHRIDAEQPDIQHKCQHIFQLLLGFAERNPGMARLLVGDALIGEHERLRVRVRQLFDRIETEIRTLFRHWGAQQIPAPAHSAAAAANLLVAVVVGQLHEFVRSDFKTSPSQHWQDHWQMLEQSLFRLQRPH